MKYPGQQDALPGLEGFVCSFQCTKGCPFPEGCLWEDPAFEADYLYPPEYIKEQEAPHD